MLELFAPGLSKIQMIPSVSLPQTIVGVHSSSFAKFPLDICDTDLFPGLLVIIKPFPFCKVDLTKGCIGSSSGG